MTKTADPIQQQLITARRRQILDAATAVLAEKGFHHATIKDIARHAGIADGTIYNYFPNKTALLLGLLDRLNESEQREADFAAGQESNLQTFLTAYLRQRLNVIWDNLELFRALLPELLNNPELRDRYLREIIAPTMAIGEGFFTAAVENGRIRSVDPSLTTRTFASAVLGLLVLHLLGDEAIVARRDDLPESLADLFLRGLELE